MNTAIRARTNVAGLHHWPHAHDSRAYLRGRHRHNFRVEVLLAVTHDERDVEFHDLKEWMDLEITDMADSVKHGLHDFGARSCETLARDLAGRVAERVGPSLLEVVWSEDGEFDAVVRA